MAKTQELVMQRDYTVRTTTGHVLTFEKGKPLRVPAPAVEECLRYGAMPPAGAQLLEDPEPTVKPEPRGEERKEVIIATMEEIAAANRREDFGANGAPNLRALEKRLGFKVDKKERDALWTGVKAQYMGQKR